MTGARAGSPFKARVTDRSAVTLITDLGELKDENDHVVLDFDTEMVLEVDISRAGPGVLVDTVINHSQLSFVSPAMEVVWLNYLSWVLERIIMYSNVFKLS